MVKLVRKNLNPAKGALDRNSEEEIPKEVLELYNKYKALGKNPGIFKGNGIPDENTLYEWTQELPEVVVTGKNYSIPYNDAGVAITKDDIIDTLSNGYSWLDDHPYVSAAYDGINLLAYLCPGTLPLAALMTYGKAAGAAANTYKEGLSGDSATDLAAVIPMSKIGTKTLGLIGKADKYVKRMPKYAINTDWLQFPPLWKAAIKNSKYLPYAIFNYGEDFLNVGTKLWQLYDDVQEGSDDKIMIDTTENAIDYFRDTDAI